MKHIDLRSDTVTWPTEKMRQAMAEAPVGDDVFGDDPTINRLEALAATKLGKEAGLFVPSGTMGNVISILAHCQRGDEVIVGDRSHTFVNEGGNPATVGGVHSWPIPTQPDGTLPLDVIEAAIRLENVHYPHTALVSLENTHNSTGGQPLSAAYTDSVGELCKKYSLKLHIDGARIFNAAAALQENVARLTQAADSVSFCLSKALCAPVGSVIVGKKEFIAQARRIRKTLGGGMRQGGILAAAGIVALEDMTERLGEDHANACRLAEGLASLPGVEIDVARVKTNIIFFRLSENARLDIKQLMAAMEQDNVLMTGTYSRREIRLVTHYWIKSEHVDFVIERMRSLLA